MESRRDAALLSPDSLSWQVFKNPVAMFVGGITAVLLELAEPRVRSGVWDHTSFRRDPLRRMQRTGTAAMVTVYGSRPEAEKMIAAIRRMHDNVTGTTPSGQAYRANDPELLAWVHMTASFGFIEAYARFVRPLDDRDRDRFYAEGTEIAALYGATGVPATEAELRERFDAMFPSLEASPIVLEFLDILDRTRILPRPFRGLQRTMIRASIDILPRNVRERLELGEDWNLKRREGRWVGWLGRHSERFPIPEKTVRRGLSMGDASNPSGTLRPRRSGFRRRGGDQDPRVEKTEEDPGGGP